MYDVFSVMRDAGASDELSVVCSVPGATNFRGNASSRNRTFV